MAPDEDTRDIGAAFQNKRSKLRSVSIDIAQYLEAKVRACKTDDTFLALIKNRTAPLEAKMPSRIFTDKYRMASTYTRFCNRLWFEKFEFLSFSRLS